MRQRIGGGVRQAGVIAAAGIVALTRMVDRLWEDHSNARVLATGLRELDERLLNYEVHTNIISIDLEPIGIDGYIRFSLATKEERIVNALTRIEDAVNQS